MCQPDKFGGYPKIQKDSRFKLSHNHTETYFKTLAKCKKKKTYLEGLGYKPRIRVLK